MRQPTATVKTIMGIDLSFGQRSSHFVGVNSSMVQELLPSEPVLAVRAAFLSVLRSKWIRSMVCRPFILEAVSEHPLCPKCCPRQEDVHLVWHLGIIDVKHQSTSQIITGVHPLQFSLSTHLPVFWGPLPYLTFMKTWGQFIQRKKHDRELNTTERILLLQPTNNIDEMFKCWPMDVIFIYGKLFIQVGLNTSEENRTMVDLFVCFTVVVEEQFTWLCLRLIQPRAASSVQN